MSPAELTAFFRRFGSARLILEVGGQSPWVSRLAHAAGMQVIVANPRRVQLITRNERKNDLVRRALTDPTTRRPRSSG